MHVKSSNARKSQSKIRKKLNLPAVDDLNGLLGKI